jgi:formylglycine-generating enzyme required for sulfatase activity
MKTIQKIVTTAILVLVCVPFWASNIQIPNGPEIVSRTATQVQVEFDVTWENSWRLTRPNNWDAAWVFMKYRIDASEWRHANLVTATPATVAGGTPRVIEGGRSTRPDGTEVTVGVFIYRSQNDTWGDVELNGVRLNWDVTGMGIDATTVLSVRVFAAEMVYVPQGSFVIGDGWSWDHLRTIGDTMFNSTWAPLMGPNWNNNRRPDNIIPEGVNANSFDGFVFSASHAGVPFQAFNGNHANWWIASTTLQWEWLQVELPTAREITWMTLSRNAAQAAHEIRGFAIQGSNDGTSWTLLYGNPEFVHPGANANYKFGRNHDQPIPIALERTGNFRFYRFWFNGTNVHVSNIQMFTGSADRINRISSPTQPRVYFAGLNNAAYPTNQLPVVGTTLQPLADGFPNGFRAFYVMKHEVTQAAWVDFLNTLTWDQQHRLVTTPGVTTPTVALPNVTPASVVGTNIFRPWWNIDDLTYPPHRMNIRIRERGLDGPAVFGVGRWATVDRQEEDPENPGQFITVTGPGWCWNHEIRGGNVPMFNLAWTDIAAYLDWAGLRPMTELEYEKACRGPMLPVREEFAWGGPFMPSNTGGVADRDLPTETPLPDFASFSQPGNAVVRTVLQTSTNASVTGVFWPVRAGSFARDATTREEAGASYWGILNLSDNVAERVVNISTVQGRAYNGRHGDGQITAMGFSNVPNWPSQDAPGLANSNSQAWGTSYRGIAVTVHTSVTTILSVSCRFVGHVHHHTAGQNQNHRDNWTGARGVRTCPRATVPTGW